jgi:3-hydroxyisobutyrate dehydrogenase
MNIAFIGTGVMGSPIVRHLANHHSVTVFNRTTKKATPLLDVAKIAGSIKDAIEDASVVFTMLGGPNDVMQVYREIFLFAQPNTILVDLTTSSPSLAINLFKQGFDHQLHLLDAPVTGGEHGAIQGTLTIMVGGDKVIFDKMLPLLNIFGKRVMYAGASGNGQHTKMANQIAIAGTLVSLAEALTYSKTKQLDLHQVLDVISGGAASSYSAIHYGKKMIEKDFKATFYVKHFLKDLTIAVEESTLSLPILQNVKKAFEILNEFAPELGVQSVIEIIDRISYKEETE